MTERGGGEHALVKPGAVLRRYRLERGMTLAELSQKTGLQPSTLSKIETGKMETTIAKLLRISLALEVSIADLFGTPTSQYAAEPSSRVRCITRAGEGEVVTTQGGAFVYQAYELLQKAFTPAVAEIHARSLEEFGPFHRHAGEEFVYVLEGELALYTDAYTPARLAKGDAVYFDSGMGHAYVAVGDGPCRILSCFLTPDNEPLELMESTAEEGVISAPARTAPSRGR